MELTSASASTQAAIQALFHRLDLVVNSTNERVVTAKLEQQRAELMPQQAITEGQGCFSEQQAREERVFGVQVRGTGYSYGTTYLYTEYRTVPLPNQIKNDEHKKRSHTNSTTAELHGQPLQKKAASSSTLPSPRLLLCEATARSSC